jgi:uncharacterized protein
MKPRAFLRGLLVIVTMVLPWATVAQSADAAKTAKAASEFVNLLAKQDFAAAVARFDPTMRSVLPEEKLRQTWQTLLKQAGALKNQARTRTSAQFGYDIGFVTSQFERMILDIKVVFDREGRVAGLFFVPTQEAAQSYSPPSYVKTNAFQEKAVTVGAGKWALPGTLATPRGAGPFPALILVHGSGPCDRDETVGANKPFRDLAGGLASKGIAVLRYEKRTRQHSAECLALGSRLTVKEETIDDALAAAVLLRHTDGIDPKRVFVLGHSLGGMLVPRIGKLDTSIAGFVIMAGPCAESFEDRMLEQLKHIYSLKTTVSPEEQKQFDDFKTAVARVKALTAADADSPVYVLGAPPRYWLDLRGYHPAQAARDLRCPMLILQGGRDYQVPPSDLETWRQALGSRRDVTFKLYPKLNHLFIAGEGKSTPAEYERAGHVAEAVISDISNWIGKR